MSSPAAEGSPPGASASPDSAPQPVASNMLAREVATAEELLDAVLDGVQHIAVIDHLDLRSLPPRSQSLDGNEIEPFLLLDGTKSIRGNCPGPLISTQPADVLKLQRTTSSQCVLRTPGDFLAVAQPTSDTDQPGRLWLDNLYIEATQAILEPAGAPSAAAAPSAPQAATLGMPQPPTLIHVSSNAELWMTNMALVGLRRPPDAPTVEAAEAGADDGQPGRFSRGMRVLPGGDVYGRNLTFAFHEWEGAAAVRLQAGTTFAAIDASLSDSTGNSIISAGEPSLSGADGSEPETFPSFAPSVAVAPAPSPASSAAAPPLDVSPSRRRRRGLLDATTPDIIPASSLWLENVEFARNDVNSSAAAIMDANPAANQAGSAPEVQIVTTGAIPSEVFSNQAHLYFEESTMSTEVPLPLTRSRFSNAGFLSEEHAWFVETEAEAVETTGLPLLQQPSNPTAFDTDLPDSGLAPPVTTRNTKGRDTSHVITGTAAFAGLLAAVVVLVMLWRWGRHLRRRQKPLHMKRSMSRSLMPQSSTRMPVLLRGGGPDGSDRSGTDSSHTQLPFPSVVHLEQVAASQGKRSPFSCESALADSHGVLQYDPSHTRDPVNSSTTLDTPAHSPVDAVASAIAGASAVGVGGTVAGHGSSLQAVSLESPSGDRDSLSAAAESAVAEGVVATGSQGGGTSGLWSAFRGSRRTSSNGGKAEEPSPASSGKLLGGRRHYFLKPESMEEAFGKTHSALLSKTQELQDALDEMGKYGESLADVYHILPSSSRKQGPHGRSLVQSVRRNADDAEFAVKFYVDREAFDRELSLRNTSQFFGVLPPTRHIEANPHGRVRGPHGFVMPPFVIFEKGVSLSEWCATGSRDFVECLEVLCAVAGQLRTLHARGLAHRRLHPRNIMWRPLGRSWMLVDFGHAAQQGRNAPLHVNLPYTPPEATMAAERGRTDITAEASADMWALGVIAQEVICGSPVSTLPSTHEEEEGGRSDSADNARGDESNDKLGPLAPTVQACLSREAALRPNAAEVLQAWQQVLTPLREG